VHICTALRVRVRVRVRVKVRVEVRVHACTTPTQPKVVGSTVAKATVAARWWRLRQCFRWRQ
jgi:hypothetical protein